MFWVSKREGDRTNSRISSLIEHVKGTFSHVFEWVKYFEQKHVSHEARLMALEKRREMPDVSARLESIERRLVMLERRHPLSEKVSQKVMANSKQYVKRLVLDLVEKYGIMSAFDVKKIVVDEQKLCAKSTLYRILRELEQEGMVGSLWQGKEKAYKALAITS